MKTKTSQQPQTSPTPEPEPTKSTSSPTGTEVTISLRRIIALCQPTADADAAFTFIRYEAENALRQLAA
jgi:hypothetical protein